MLCFHDLGCPFQDGRRLRIPIPDSRILCFREFLLSKNFMPQRVMSRLSVENFLSHSDENFRRGILYCCINFGYRKSLDRRWGRGVSRNSVGKFLPHSAYNFCRESFTVALISGTEKAWIRGGGSVKIFRRQFFVS